MSEAVKIWNMALLRGGGHSGLISKRRAKLLGTLSGGAARMPKALINQGLGRALQQQRHFERSFSAVAPPAPLRWGAPKSEHENIPKSFLERENSELREFMINVINFHAAESKGGGEIEGADFGAR